MLRIRPEPVTVYGDYVARVVAPDTIEIRSQVTGVLQRVAFVEGAFVHRGDLLYVIDRRPFVTAVRQAEADLAQAQAQADVARVNAGRYSELVRGGVVSRQEYDAYATAARATAAVAASKEAVLRDARINLGYCEITAPNDGSVNRSLVQPGALVTAQLTQLTTLYAGDSYYVYFAVEQDEMANLVHPRGAAPSPRAVPEQTYEILLDDGSVLPTRGRIDFISPSIDQTTGTLQARLTVPQNDQLRPGQYVRVRAPVVQRENGILVPQRAVSELQGRRSVFVVRDGKIRSRHIEAEHRLGNAWLVDRGLSASEMIVVEGTNKVREGEHVRTVPYAASARG